MQEARDAGATHPRARARHPLASRDAVLAAAELLAARRRRRQGASPRSATPRSASSALRSLGIEPGGTVPPALRAQLKALEEDQKRRATRSLRDGIDRILVDLLSLYRDILLLQLGRRASSR